MNGICGGCNQSSWLTPLHGEKGGPLRCFLCAGEWHARYTRRRKWGRIVIKAMRMFLKEGGRYGDLDKLKLHVSPLSGLAWIEEKILPGYADTIGTDVGDITSELLADTLQLTHPDRHPPERQDLARRVTQELLALKPFVFPAPKPKPFVPTPPRDASSKDSGEPSEKPSQIYPCELCADQVPYFYCDPCKTEWNKRQAVERERENAKQRKWYARRKARRGFGKPPRLCATCGGKLQGKRKDARFCSGTCRQKAHRKVVTAKNSPAGGMVNSRNEGIPFMITNAMKAHLRDLGATEQQIQNMTPAEAHAALGEVQR
jgi:hypothetical protein